MSTSTATATEPSSPTETTRRAGPWDALLGMSGRRRLHAVHPAEDDADSSGSTSSNTSSSSKVAILLAELATVGSLPTAALGSRCDLDSRQVWGLLKTPRDAGQVVFEGGRWALTRDYPGREIQRAVKLLQARGWHVQPPSSSSQQRCR